jgi:capsular polysaccharide biosynthesis protein
MKNKKLLIIISIAVLVIGAGLWYIISKSKAAAD